MKKLLTAGAVSLAMFGGFQSASAATYDLAFIMDESGSVTASNYLAAMDSLAAALTANIGAAELAQDTYNITVITFSTSATVLVQQEVDSLADLAIVTNAIDTDAYTGGWTDYLEAFTLLNNTAGALSAGSAGSIINMTTDGAPCPASCPATQAELDAIAAMANTLNSNGWDALGFEAIGAGPDTSYLSSLGFDTTDSIAQIIGSPALIGNPFTDSFVLTVNSYAGYNAAIDAKVAAIITQGVVPVPASLPLLASGFVALGAIAVRRRKRA